MFGVFICIVCLNFLWLTTGHELWQTDKLLERFHELNFRSKGILLGCSVERRENVFIYHLIAILGEIAE
jgi:hypothetical protein